MGRTTRWLGVIVTGMCGWLTAGCTNNPPDWATPSESLSKDICEPQPLRVTRLQASEGSAVTLQKPLPGTTDQGATSVIAPPPPLPGQPNPVIGPPPPLPGTNGTLQTSLTSRGTTRVSVRAWVNGKPIFDDEVIQAVGPEMRRIQGMPEPQRSERLAETVNTVLDNIIDSELMYQDAVKRLEKAQPRALDKLKDVVEQEYEKSLKKMRQANVPEEHIREIEPVAKRMLERNLISTEYARSRILDLVKSRITLTIIRDYYDEHKNEFQTVDKIEWQDIFIPINPNLPTVDAVKRFAEERLVECRSANDFNRLMVYNEGDSKLRNGEGLGRRRGEIRPAELETVLFQLHEGEIGPIIPFSTGVHLIRVTKRDYAGQLPLDAQTQKDIRKKLENQMAEREYRRIVRELRARAVIRLERSAMGN